MLPKSIASCSFQGMIIINSPPLLSSMSERSNLLGFFSRSERSNLDLYYTYCPFIYQKDSANEL